MCVSESGCGLQDNWPSRDTEKSSDRELECEIRGYLERHLDSEQIATRMRLDIETVDKYLHILRSSP